MDDLESDDESVDTPLVSPFLDSDDGEVLNELYEYGNAGMLRRKRIINSFDGDDLAFQCMIGFRKFVAYFDPFLPMNIITRKAYNTIMVYGLESTGMNLVAIVRDIYVFVGSFTYVTDFVVLEDIGEFILNEIADVVMGGPFKEVTRLKYDCAKGLVSFTRIFDNYTFQMPRTIPRFKSWGHVAWSKILHILVLSERDLINGFRHAHEKNKLMYKKYLNLGRKAHLLWDKQIQSVRVCGEVTWMAFGGNARDLGSILEETGQDCNWTQRRHEESVTEGGDDIRKPCDAVWK
ncbi:hypothetical protein Tco_0241780 [Tanacetum coccineum]